VWKNGGLARYQFVYIKYRHRAPFLKANDNYWTFASCRFNCIPVYATVSAQWGLKVVTKMEFFNFGRSLRHHLWEMFQYFWTSLLGASSPTRDIFRNFDRLKNNRILTENAQTCETWQIASQYDAVMRLHGWSAWSVVAMATIQYVTPLHVGTHRGQH